MLAPISTFGLKCARSTGQSTATRVFAARLQTAGIRRRLCQSAVGAKQGDADEDTPGGAERELPDLAEVSRATLADAGFTSESEFLSDDGDEDQGGTQKSGARRMSGERQNRKKQGMKTHDGRDVMTGMQKKLRVTSKFDDNRIRKEKAIKARTEFGAKKQQERLSSAIFTLDAALQPLVEKIQNGACTPLTLMKTLKQLKDDNQMDPAWTLFKFALQHRIVNILHFNLILGFYVKRKEVKKAQRLYKQLDAYQLKPTVSTFNTLIKGWGQTGDLIAAFQILDEMTIREGLEPDNQTYNILINYCAKMGQAKKAFEAFEQMQQRTNLEPDVVTFSVLIEAAGEAKDLDRAFDAYNQMLKKGITPDVKAIGALVDACKKTGNNKRAFEVLKLARVQGLEPNLFVYNTLLDVCAKSAALGRAIKIFNMMVEAKVMPDEITYNSLLDNCRACSKVTKAWEIWDTMKDYGVKPSLLTYMILEDVCRKSQDYAGLRRAQKMRKECTNLPKMFLRKAFFWSDGVQHRVMCGPKNQKGYFHGSRQVRDLYYYLKTQTKYKQDFNALPKEAVEKMSSSQKTTSLLFHCEKKALAAQIKRDRPYVETNAKMCTDCQSFFLYTSLAWDKEIVCQDATATRVWRNGILVS